MFSELFTYLTTPCPQYARHMDYLDEIIAMRGRYRRHRTSWQPHLDSTRRFVLSAAGRSKNRNKAVILGAGLLLDVPLDELSSMFREVVLLDIVQLPEVRRTVKRYDNVKFIAHDITNVAEQLYKNVQRDIRELPRSTPVIPEIDENAGLVVSLNILSQLWVVPRAYALKKLPGLEEELLDDWCRQIVESHTAFLRSLPGTVCLVADHEFVKSDREGNIASKGSTVFDVKLPKPVATWTWDIIPMNDDRQYLSRELNVGAWYL